MFFSRLPDGDSQILRFVCVWPFGLEELWLRYATLQKLIPSFPWIAHPTPPPWHIPRKGRDKILPSGNTGSFYGGFLAQHASKREGIISSFALIFVTNGHCKLQQQTDYSLLCFFLHSSFHCTLSIRYCDTAAKTISN